MLATNERIYLSSRARAAIIWIAVGVALLFLWQVRGILTPFIWAIVTAYVLNPVVVFLARRTGLSRRLWAILCYVILLGLLILGLSTLVPLLSEQLTEFVDRIADVGAQHVLAEELMEHLTHGALQKRDPARVPRAMPGIRSVLRVMHQGSEKRRGK